MGLNSSVSGVLLVLMLTTSSAIAMGRKSSGGSNSSCRYTRSELTSIEDARSISDFNNHDSYADDWACLELKDHLKDDSLKNCTPAMDTVFSAIPSAPTRISGSETYHLGSLPSIGFRGVAVKKRYQYEISPAQNGGIDITVRIHFTGEKMSEPGVADKLHAILERSADLWTQQSPVADARFHFLMVAENESPDFTVELKPAKGDLYDSFWDSRMLNESFVHHTFAHELGHMMGIPDEYDPIRDSIWKVKSPMDTARCNTRGMMCSSYEGKTYPYYYYLILRRSACQG